MKRYIALLRGINISGKNKISMPELKAHFTELGYNEVITYLNSGNVAFSTEEADETLLAKKICSMIKEQLSLDISVYVISREELKNLLNKAPEWWGTADKSISDNLIFVMPSATAEEIAE